MLNTIIMDLYEFARLKLATERYEKVRKLNVVQFKKLYDQNITTGTPFDRLVDELEL